MRESTFNVITERNDGSVLFYNSFSDAFSIMDAEGYATFKTLRNTNYRADEAVPGTAELIAQLKRGGFIVDDGMDEIAFLKQRYENYKLNCPNLRLYVIPTGACNFNCKYCYYAEPDNAKMPESVQDALLAFTKKKLVGKRALNVVWTGGEPTLAPDVVAPLSKKFLKLAEESGVDYYAAIFTNGYLFDRETAEEFSGYGIRIAQFVLDGPREIHNERRQLIGGAGTFDVILKNLKDASEIMNIAIRINFDSTNSDGQYISSLLDSFKRCGLPTSTIIELAPVFGYTSQCGDYIKKYGLKKKEIAKRLSWLYPIVFDSGFTPKFNISNSENLSPCTANSCFGVSKDGDLYRCFLLIGEQEECAGTIFEGDKILEQDKNNSKWNEWNPFSIEECLKCNILPICLGGCGCPLYDVVEDGHLRSDVRCMPLKFYLNDAMELNHRIHEKRRQAGNAV